MIQLESRCNSYNQAIRTFGDCAQWLVRGRFVSKMARIIVKGSLADKSGKTTVKVV